LAVGAGLYKGESQGRRTGPEIITDYVLSQEYRAELSRLKEIAEAAKGLALAEGNFRITHDTKGGSSIACGVAWDEMRRAGDALRTALTSYFKEAK
jgi:hypothetical protein